MNKAGIISLLASFFILFFGAYLDGIALGQLIQGHAAMMVIGLSITAVMLHHTGAHCLDALKLLKEVFKPSSTQFNETIDNFRGHSKDVRQSGLLHFETMADAEDDEVVKKLLMMAADGYKPELIEPITKRQIENQKKRLMTTSSVYDALGGYAPTMGILGAVLGLMKVMSNMDDPTQLGSGIASAFVATIYGVFFANTVFLPLGNHFKIRAVTVTAYREMILDGVLGIINKAPMDHLEASMASFIPACDAATVKQLNAEPSPQEET